MNRSRYILYSIVSLALIGVTIALSTFLYIRYVVHNHVHNSTPQLLYIPPGSSLNSVSRSAHQLGIVEAPWQFKYAARWIGAEHALHAGEYKLGPDISIIEAAKQISEGKRYLRRLVVPEGLSVKETVSVLENSFGLNMTDFMMPEEGSLLPNTYFYERGDTGNQLIQRMQRALQEVLDRYWKARASDLPVNSKEEALILASIVEKETALATERPLVASVFINRLKRGMRLQSDPTIIYGITGGTDLGRPIKLSEISALTPYNTYKIKGLPPTPIANPGEASIKAVLQPAESNYLYFVADGTGGHAFAETLKAHNQNVSAWRKLEQNSQPSSSK